MSTTIFLSITKGKEQLNIDGDISLFIDFIWVFANLIKLSKGDESERSNKYERKK